MNEEEKMYLEKFLEMHKKLIESGYYTDKEFHLKKRDEIVSMMKNDETEEALKEMSKYLLTIQLNYSIIRLHKKIIKNKGL